jgi:hypothetical protein
MLSTCVLQRVLYAKGTFLTYLLQPNDDIYDHDQSTSRAASATSSLDPYYFGIQTPYDAESVPPLPSVPSSPKEMSSSQFFREPVTPARDPANIDRRALHGLGELATPRWTRPEHSANVEDNEPLISPQEAVSKDDTDEDEPDSPWTIEAVDGESSERDEVSTLPFHLKHLLTVISTRIPNLNRKFQHALFALGLLLQKKAEVKRYYILANLLCPPCRKRLCLPLSLHRLIQDYKRL